MCFVVLAYRQHRRYRLVLATNRDEFYDRPTAPAAFRQDAPGVLAGRDLQGGGTWLGVTRTGRWAGLTNVREPGAHRPEAPTRGALVADFLTGTQPANAYLAALHGKAERYNGFNLLVGDAEGVYYFGNRGGAVRRLEPGLYGLSNHLLDTPWPKIERGKAALAAVLADDPIDPETLLGFLADTQQAPDEILPDTGIGLTWERMLSSIFITSPKYGTRVSTVILIEEDGVVTLVERAYVPNTDAQSAETVHYTFQIDPETVPQRQD